VEPAEASKLDRRREKSRIAHEVAERAAAIVAAVDAQLTANAGQTEQDQAALRNARDEVVRLKRALKSADKDRAALRKRRANAGALTARAQVKAQRAEKRYDQEVLADIVRREKDRDRAAASAAGTAHPTPAS
jgi:hypothetical protein